MQKVALSASLACLFLLVLNFTFDYTRHLDSKSSRGEVESWANEAEARCQSAQAVLDQRLARAYALILAFEARSKAEGNASEQILQLTGELSRRMDEISALVAELQAQASNAADRVATTEAPKDAPGDTPKKLKLLDTGIDTILDHEQSLKSRNAYLEYEVTLAGNLGVPSNWSTTEEMIKKFEEHYGVQLTREERQMWRLKLGAYKNLISAAHTRYMASLDSSVYERLQKDGVDKYKQGNQKPMPQSESRKVFASINRGSITMQFKKDEFPEIYRMGKVADYIPFVMMDEVKAFFQGKAAGR